MTDVSKVLIASIIGAIAQNPRRQLSLYPPPLSPNQKEKSLPNITGEGSDILLRIREIPSSHLGPETGYLMIYRGFPQSQTNAGLLP
jgi:hypothetical protein